MKNETKKAPRQKPRVVILRPSSYQPSKAEKEEELDMPEADIETVRAAFFRPIKVKKK